MGLRALLRRSRNFNSSRRVAGYNAIGIFTRLKLIEPFQIALINKFNAGTQRGEWGDDRNEGHDFQIWNPLAVSAHLVGPEGGSSLRVQLKPPVKPDKNGKRQSTDVERGKQPHSNTSRSFGDA